MEKQSESWCSWFVSKIKSCFCPKKKTYLETIPKAAFQSITNSLNMRGTMEISFANKNLNAKANNHHGGQKLYLEATPETPFQSIANFLNIKDTMALGFANKQLNKNVKIHCNTFIYLLDCVRACMLYECGDRLVMLGAKLIDHAREKFTDYATLGKFDYKDRQVRIRTLKDFANTFIREKDLNKYNNLVAQLPNMCQEINDWPDYGQKRPNRKEFNDFMAEFIKSAGFTSGYIYCRGYKDRFRNGLDTKKQIINYKNVTGKSYKSIYYHLKKNPDPEKPEKEDYIKAYEELKGRPKRDGYGCDIF